MIPNEAPASKKKSQADKEMHERHFQVTGPKSRQIGSKFQNARIGPRMVFAQKMLPTRT